MVRQHHQVNGHEFEQTLGDSEGKGSLACCSPWGLKESHTTWWLNKNKQQRQSTYVIIDRASPGSVVKNPPACRRCRLGPWVGKIPRRRNWQTILVLLPGKPHGQSSMWSTVLGVARVQRDSASETTTILAQLLTLSGTFWKTCCTIPFRTIAENNYLSKIMRKDRICLYIKKNLSQNHHIKCSHEQLSLPYVFFKCYFKLDYVAQRLINNDR